MPCYEAICRKCKKTHDYVRSVANYLDTPECCGEKTEKVILTAPKGHVQMDVCYDSPIDGRPITSWAAREEDMKRNNCRPWEGMEAEKKEVKRQEQEMYKAIDKIAEKAVDEAWAQLPTESRNALSETI